MDLYQSVVYFLCVLDFYFQYMVINYNITVFYDIVYSVCFHDVLFSILYILNPFHRRIEKVPA